ncbi:hypothetical protein, partial [Campylobacter concisus]
GTEIEDGSKVTANTTDPSGNKSGDGEATAGDSTAPTYKATVKFDEDNDGNGKLSKAENDKDGEAGKTTATITVPSNAEVGDSIVYTVNGGEEKTQEITQEIKNNGFKVEVPVTDGQTATVTAKIVDPAGNAGDKSEASIDVDLTAPTYKATVKFDEDNDGNGKLSKAENDKDGEAG